MNPATLQVIPVHQTQRTDTLINLTHLLTWHTYWLFFTP